jgi:hypothetical protein
MIRESERATAAAVAQSESPRRLYHRRLSQTTAINEVLAKFVFSLQNPRLHSSERISVLDAIDGLVRLKVDLGLLREVHHAQ